MDIAKYTDNLDKLLSKNVIDDSDALHFVNTLFRLSKEVKSEGGFHKYGPIVNQWIRAFKPLFCDRQIDDSTKLCIRKSSKILTHIFLSLMQSLDKYEPNHSLEFFGQWKLVMSATNAQKMANYVSLYSQQFKSLIENLRTATTRCDQLAILAVVLMYFEKVSSDKLTKLRQNFNSYILDKLVDLNRHQKLLMNQHSFLHDIDAMGHSIISLKATKIICDDISLSLNTSMHALWIDFNIIDRSITLVAVSPTQNTLTFLALLPRPKLIERLSDEHELKIRGWWSIIDEPNGTIQKRATIKVYLPIHDRNAVWKAKVKSIFRFVLIAPTYSQSLSSQDTESRTFDRRLAHLRIHGLDDQRYGLSPNDDSFTSFSMSASQIQPRSITPIARTQFDADEESLFNVNRDNVTAAKGCIENIPAIDQCESERDRLPDLPIDQQTFIVPIHNPLNDPLLNPFEDQLDDQLSDHSSGISFGNDVSVLDDGLSGNGIDADRQRFRASSHGSFSSAVSTLSEIDKQVKRFIEGTQSVSGQQASQSRKQHSDGNGSGQRASQPRKQQYNENRSIASANEERTKSSSPKDSSFEKRNPPIRSAYLTSPRRTEHAKKTVKGAVELQNGSMRTCPSDFSLLKGHSSKQMHRNERMGEPPSVNICMADYCSDQDDKPTDAPVNVQSDLALMSNETDGELAFDDEGRVSDKRGRLFDNNDEVEEALYVYIENNGLEYLKSEAFKSANAERRQRSEREFRAIHKMIDRQFEDDTHSPNGSIVLRGTAKRKLWNCLDDGSTCSSHNDILQQPTKKPKNGDASMDNAGITNATGDKEPNVEDGNVQDVPCALTQHTAVIDYLKDFIETREMCGMHRVQLLELITKIQANNIMALNGKVPIMTTIANIQTICQQAREHASMILDETYKQ